MLLGLRGKDTQPRSRLGPPLRPRKANRTFILRPLNCRFWVIGIRVAAENSAGRETRVSTRRMNSARVPNLLKRGSRTLEMEGGPNMEIIARYQYRGRRSYYLASFSCLFTLFGSSGYLSSFIFRFGASDRMSKDSRIFLVPEPCQSSVQTLTNGLNPAFLYLNIVAAAVTTHWVHAQ